jgi:hypothetical protein
MRKSQFISPPQAFELPKCHKSVVRKCRLLELSLLISLITTSARLNAPSVTTCH